MSYAEAIQFLYQLRMFGAKFGLENTRKLAALAGNPQERLQFIHVAGTNGKGSTCAMLESIYRQAGLRVGLFTSPHLVSFAERIQVDRRLITEPEVVRLVCGMKPLLAQFSPDAPPTFFEVVTIMALRYFAEQQCQLVVLETGLGGRLDATNIVLPLVSVITNIDFDHQQWLGDTLEKIAAEKAGIIKPRVPVVTATSRRPALEVIAAAAGANDAPLTVIDGNDAKGPRLDAVNLALAGDHQRLNAALAIGAVRAVGSRIPASDEAMMEGLSRVHWPGRMQLVATTNGQTLLLDGAHNQASAWALAAAFRKKFPAAHPTLILGVLRDKDGQAILEALLPLASRTLLVPVQSERTLSPEELMAMRDTANPMVPVEPCVSLAEALQKSVADPFILITGSLYLIGEAMEQLHLSPVPTVGERGLNEWAARA